MWPLYDYMGKVIDKTDDVEVDLFQAAYPILRADFLLASENRLPKDYVVPKTEPDIPTGIYNHYKGGKYNILGTGFDLRHNGWFILYEPYAQKGDEYYVRSIENFLQQIDEKTHRFTKVN